jgi:hypothetical protein
MIEVCLFASQNLNGGFDDNGAEPIERMYRRPFVNQLVDGFGVEVVLFIDKDRIARAVSVVGCFILVLVAIAVLHLVVLLSALLAKTPILIHALLIEAKQVVMQIQLLHRVLEQCAIAVPSFLFDEALEAPYGVVGEVFRHVLIGCDEDASMLHEQLLVPVYSNAGGMIVACVCVLEECLESLRVVFFESDGALISFLLGIMSTIDSNRNEQRVLTNSG